MSELSARERKVRAIWVMGEAPSSPSAARRFHVCSMKWAAAHIAVAAVHGMDFLMTWNCIHLANATNARAPAACGRTPKIPLACARGSVDATRYRAAIAKERLLPRAASPDLPEATI